MIKYVVRNHVIIHSGGCSPLWVIACLRLTTQTGYYTLRRSLNKTLLGEACLLDPYRSGLTAKRALRALPVVCTQWSGWDVGVSAVSWWHGVHGVILHMPPCHDSTQNLPELAYFPIGSVRNCIEVHEVHRTVPCTYQGTACTHDVAPIRQTDIISLYAARKVPDKVSGCGHGTLRSGGLP